MWRVAAIAGALIMSLSSATVAHASAVSTDAVTGDVVVRADPGEANAVTLRVAPNPERLVRVRDDGAVLRAGAGCVAVDGHVADCSALRHAMLRMVPAQPDVLVDVGDGDDRVVSSLPADMEYLGRQVRLKGGAGNDVLVGSMVLGADGGPGDDVIASDNIVAGVLTGGPGRDYVQGVGSDQINEGNDDASPDHLEGSTVSYLGRTSGVRIDLSGSATHAANAEGDLLIGTRAVFGTDHDDVLIATRPRNGHPGSQWDTELYGMGGNDVLHAGDLRDYLNGGGGVDRLIGEGGDDKLVERTGVLSCGPGHDVVVLAQHTPGTDCEENEIEPELVRLRAALRAHMLLVRLTSAALNGPGDAVRISVPRPQRDVRYRPVTLKRLPITLRIALGPRALAAVRQRRAITVRYRRAGQGWRAAATVHLRVRIKPNRGG